MKYLKIRVRKHPNGVVWARKHNQATMIYPDGYSDVEFEEAGYVWDLEDAVTGEIYSVVLAAAKDNTPGLTQLLLSPDVTEMTIDEIKQFSEDNEDRKESITDEAKVRRIEIKANLGQALTTEELKAIDPDDPTPGISKKDILADKFDKIHRKRNKIEPK